MRRAQSSVRSPSGVKPTKREPRCDQHHAEDFLELLQAGRHRRLGDAAGFGGAAEMPFLGQSQQEFEFVDQAVGPGVANGAFSIRNTIRCLRLVA